MTDRDRISITRPQSEWMRNLTEHELSDFWRGINMARESGMIPNNLHTVVHVLLRWVLSDNGIYYRDLSYEEDD